MRTAQRRRMYVRQVLIWTASVLCVAVGLSHSSTPWKKPLLHSHECSFVFTSPPDKASLSLLPQPSAGVQFGSPNSSLESRAPCTVILDSATSRSNFIQNAEVLSQSVQSGKKVLLFTGGAFPPETWNICSFGAIQVFSMSKGGHIFGKKLQHKISRPQFHENNIYGP